MNIKDLAVAKELSHEERAVRGGAGGNIAVIGGTFATNSANGVNFGPQTSVAIGPVVDQIYAPVTTVTKVDLNSLSAVDSLVDAFQK